MALTLAPEGEFDATLELLWHCERCINEEGWRFIDYVSADGVGLCARCVAELAPKRAPLFPRKHRHHRRGSTS